MLLSGISFLLLLLSSCPGSGTDPRGNETALLMRKHRDLGTMSDEDMSVPEEKKRVLAKISKTTPIGSVRLSRASLKPLYLKPRLFKHEQNKDEPKGCGNPICVIIDRKPRRFKSICQYVSFAWEKNRKQQVNFLQKGDCYDIIDYSEGAKQKPWISPTEDLSDCAACQADDSCGSTVTVNIDLKNILYGVSSAFGGPLFHETEAKRMVGIPLEFRSVCHMMNWFKSSTNVNLKTQVVGLAVGKREDIYPENSESEVCLWTEWFDQDTPCNSQGDWEKHSQHFCSLQESWTGSSRICRPSEMGAGQHTQFEAGSELTLLSLESLNTGNLKQNVHADLLSLECQDLQQTIGKLPPPFIFGEGVRGNNKKNATCLNYKSRYCCKSSALFRPTAVSYLENILAPMLPVGILTGSVHLHDDGSLKDVLIKIQAVHGSGKISEIKITVGQDGSVSGSFSGVRRFTITGTAKSKQLPDGTSLVALKLICHHSDFAIIKLTIRDGDIQELSTSDTHGIKIISKKITNKDINLPKLVVKTRITYKEQEMIILSWTDIGGHQTKIEGNIQFESATENIWLKIKTLFQNLNVPIFVDSPPLALLFSECEWRDWVSQEYPSKARTGAEWEIRQELVSIPKLSKHVCGKVPEKAMYVDAMTRERQEPWYEAKVDGQDHEVYLLNPFHGYVCNDQNMPGVKKACQDMKLRFCCVKALRAQWSLWGEWSSCSQSCDGGIKERKRTCQQTSIRKDGSGLTVLSYNPLCVGEERESSKRQMSQQRVICEVQGCPEDYRWTPWSVWSSCGQTCSEGSKERVRSCRPAANGGKACPDKRKNPELYRQVEKCFLQDCDIYFPGQWSAWTECSVTCGKGEKIRHRTCYSEQKQRQVGEDMCTSLSYNEFYQQIQDCKLRECPVEGAWTTWGAWSPCSQDCIHYPTDGKTVVTSARRTRKRHCTNPHPAWGGEFCLKDGRYTWLSHERAEQDETACLTALSGGNMVMAEDLEAGAKVTPWCPENCVLTAWGQWSSCSQTCVISSQGPTVSYWGYFPKHRNSKYHMAKNIIMYPPHPPLTLPRRERVRTVLKEARFGGTCPELYEPFMNQQSKDLKAYFQSEACKLCPEHCPDDRKVYDWPALPYPGADQSCVGYCPIDCKWEDPIKEEDCQKAQDDYFKELQSYVDEDSTDTDSKHAIKHKCYLSHVYLLLISNGFEAIALEYKTEMEGYIKDAKEGKEVFPWSYRDVIALAPLLRSRSRVVRRMKRSLYGGYHDDVDTLLSLIKTVTVRKAVVPVLDGLYGGSPCIRTKDKKQLTVRKDDDPKYNSSSMTNEYPEEFLDEFDSCTIKICTPGLIPPPPPTERPECKTARWSSWGSWGSCDPACSAQGLRKRKRICQNVCSGEKASQDSCPGFHNTFYNKTFTDTDWTRCSPCPAEDMSCWSEWGEWRIPGTYSQYCGGGGVSMQRQRVCVQGHSKTACPGEDRETKTVPMPGCEGEYDNDLDMGMEMDITVL